MSSSVIFASKSIVDYSVWREDKGTVEWAKENIYLGQDVTPYTGMINFDRTTWIEEILNDWDKPHIQQYNIMASTQVGKTTIEFCCISKELDTDPCMMQLTIPTDDGVADFVKTKFDPFFNGIKTLKTKVAMRKDEEKTRLKSALKEVPNGMLFILGNTEKNRRSKTVKNIFIDEAALFGKGHIKELIGRTKFYEKSGRKIFVVSSRKHIGDEIEIEYENSYCKKELQILCTGCEEYFYPTSKHFKYMDEDEYCKKYNFKSIENKNDYKREAIQTARVECECGHHTTSKDIENLVRNKKVKLVLVEGSDSDTIHGYKLNALATALTKYSTIAEALIEAGEEEEEKRTIYQDYFNETLDGQSDSVTKKSDILLLSNKMNRLVVPKDTNALHLGVDLQKNRLYYVLGGVRFGDGMVADTISHGELFSEGISLDWQHLEEMLDAKYYDEDGKAMRISSCGIDIRGFALHDQSSDNVTRSQEALNFIFDYRQKLEDWGVTNAENFIYPTLGFPTLSDKTKDYVTRQRKMSREVDGITIDKKLNELHFSNFRIKSQLFNMIDRNIAKVKASEDEPEFNYDRNLLYINEDIVRDAEARENLPPQERLYKHSFEAHMVSEHLIKKVMKNGRLADQESFEKKYDGIRNDYLDCWVSIILQSLHLMTYRTPAPVIPDIVDNKTRVSRLSGAI